MSVFPDHNALAALCRQHQIKKLSVFGSFAKGTATAASDVDLLVEFRPGIVHGLTKLSHIKWELSDLVGGRKVDLITLGGLNQPRRSRFPNIFRDEVLATAKIEYKDPEVPDENNGYRKPELINSVMLRGGAKFMPDKETVRIPSRIEHMIDAISQALEFLKDVSETDFIDNKMLNLAVSRLMEIIGEAANRIPRDFHLKNPQINWEKLVDLRNDGLHEYGDINLTDHWHLVKNDFPELLRQLEELHSAF
ncbi:MAG: DUF86 domain-containing protein [Candidatus Symbiobacter sp.]|nr:DUF86 domain-containing protein [Candidatus Symbiobacter sp.]